jgi:hypothetical protein
MSKSAKIDVKSLSVRELEHLSEELAAEITSRKTPKLDPKWVKSIHKRLEALGKLMEQTKVPLMLEMNAAVWMEFDGLTWRETQPNNLTAFGKAAQTPEALNMLKLMREGVEMLIKDIRACAKECMTGMETVMKVIDFKYSYRHFSDDKVKKQVVTAWHLKQILKDAKSGFKME